MENGNVLIYQEKSGEPVMQVTFDHETLWLSQRAMAELFDKDSDTIGLHIKNIYNDGELEEKATTEKSSVVQQEGKRTVKRPITRYNLDVILSVGYRVNSKKGTQFRIWANRVLKDYLVKGYALNEKRLKDQSPQFEALKTTVKLLGNVAGNKMLSSDEASGLNAIQGLRARFGGSSLFGNEKDESFKSSIATIYQSFGGADLYTSVEEKAANLLYFVVKNHSFSDGNKRIAAFLFVWFFGKEQLALS